jgi:DNA polymerase/3'-5' exonuclease PolX
MQLMQLTQTINLFPPTKSRATKAATQPALPGLEMPATEKPPVTNRQIAEVLNNIAELLEIQQSNPYRIMAYRNATRGVLALEEPATMILARQEPLPIPGLGKRLRQRIAELVATGTMTFYNDLCIQSLPAGVRTLMRIHFVGIQTALRLYEELGIDTPEKLWNATTQERIRQLPGFGPRSEARLQAAVKEFLTHKQKVDAVLDGVA